MSASESSNPPLSVRQIRRRADAERRWLALGAARERSRNAAAGFSLDNKRQLTSAIDSWENEGGTAIGVAMSSRPKPLRLTKLQWCADLFRDDTTMRAVIINGLLILIAGTIAIILMNV